MTYKIKASQIFALPSCRGEYQVGDSYCSWSKIAVSALGITKITSSPTYTTYDMGIMYEDARAFLFDGIRDTIGQKKFSQVTELNDSQTGHFYDNHNRAVRLAIQYAVESGIVELEDEDNDITRELRKQINECKEASNTGVPA